jgi:hypothetical protein
VARYCAGSLAIDTLASLIAAVMGVGLPETPTR